MPKKELTPKDELFCQYYSRGGSGTFGNARKSYAMAFDKKIETEKQKALCDNLAGRLLGKVVVLNRCNELLDKLINDDVADRELAYTMAQRENLHAKVSAIGEFNKVRGRITTKIKHKFEGVGDEALKERLADIVAGSDGDSGGTRSEEKGE